VLTSGQPTPNSLIGLFLRRGDEGAALGYGETGGVQGTILEGSAALEERGLQGELHSDSYLT